MVFMRERNQQIRKYSIFIDSTWQVEDQVFIFKLRDPLNQPGDVFFDEFHAID